jgi:predicted transcriptional regulator
MTLLELKKSIHEKIDHLNDERFLEHIEAIIDSKESVFIIPEHMKEGIRQGEEDIKNGRYITLEELEKKYEKWLKE